MALSKTWYTSGNLALASTGTATLCAYSSIWGILAMLTGNQSGTNGPEGARPSGCYWTLVGSSNSSTAGIDGTDRLHLAGAFTSGDWVRNTAGNAHSWCVLQSPNGLLDGPWYLCFDYIGPSNDQTGSFVISKNAFTGGSTTARPTSTGESVIVGQQFCSTTAGAGKLYLSTDANGGFRVLRSRNGTAYFDFVLAVEPAVEYHSGDAARTFMWSNFNDASPGTLLDTTNGIVIRGLCYDGTTALTGSNMNIANLSLRPTGTGLGANATALNVIDSTLDMYPCMYLYDVTATKKAGRGRFPDMWEVGLQVVAGSTVPATGDPERIVFGHFAMPGSVAPSL